MRLNIATKKLLKFMIFPMVVSFNCKLPQRSHVSGLKKKIFSLAPIVNVWNLSKINAFVGFFLHCCLACRQINH